MKDEKKLYLFFPFLIASFVAAAFAYDGIAALKGFLKLQLMPSRLLSDFFITAGIGPSFLNAAVVGFSGFLLVILTKTKLSGPTFAAVFTMMGFGFFGKTLLNILPILFGVFLAAKYTQKTFREYIIIALFGTALGPLVSAIAFELGLPLPLSIILGAAGGIFTGFLLPSMAVSMLHMHQGYNLYNMGLTCGFLSLFAASLLKAGGASLDNVSYWFSGQPLLLELLVPVISFILIVLGLMDGGVKSLSDFKKIQTQTGRLPSDFIDSTSFGGVFINAGLIGLVGAMYIHFVGGDFNGPVLGGLFTIMGFSAFGTNLKNAWPVVIGVIVSALIFKIPLDSPGVQLAVIFCTTLSPIAGQFGILPGIIAGFLHLLLVSQSGTWQGGMNLYNNGFAGGLTATFLIAFFQWYRTNKKENRLR